MFSIEFVYFVGAVPPAHCRRTANSIQEKFMSTTNPGSQALGAIRVVERGAGASEARPAGRRRRAGASGWRRVISPIALLVVWQLTHVAHLVSATKLPPPTAV